MTRTGRWWLAPAASVAFVVLAVATDLWRGDPPPPEPTPVHVPAVPLAPPFAPDGPVANPFRAGARDEKVSPLQPPAPTPVASVEALPTPAPPPPPPPPLPTFSGVLTQGGVTYVVTPGGMVPEGGMIGPWRVVSAGQQGVVVQEADRTVRMTATGQPAK